MITGFVTGGLSSAGFVFGASAPPLGESAPAGTVVSDGVPVVVPASVDSVAPDLIAAWSAFSSFSNSSRLFRSMSVFISDGIGGGPGKLSFGLSFMKGFMKALKYGSAP